MEILGGLVKLSEDGVLPAPWFNRPSLGLVTNTAVRIAVVKAVADSDAPPDIIVTPLKTDRLHCTATVTADFLEKSGTISRALQQVTDSFNIALAETVTVDQRTRHRITLVLEPPDGRAPYFTESYKNQFTKFEEFLKDVPGYISANTAFQVDDRTSFERQETSTVSHGTISYSTVKEWYWRRYYEKYKDRYDFSKVVVSSSADGRYLRYVFPKIGAFQATISHVDMQTALVQIGGVFEQLGYNILLSRLSRSMGDVPAADKSIYVVVCEPSSPPPPIGAKNYRNEVSQKITTELDAIDADFQLVLVGNQVSLGASIATVAYPYRQGISPAFQSITAPRELGPFLQKYARRKKRAIFLSYRNALVKSSHGVQLQGEVIARIVAKGAEAFDGFHRPAPLQDEEAADVRARMWTCSAAIFFAADAADSGALSGNQLVEWGFMYGQGKPWAIIVKESLVGNVKNFMIPERSFITYENLDTPAAIADVGKKVDDLLDRWYPKSQQYE